MTVVVCLLEIGLIEYVLELSVQYIKPRSGDGGFKLGNKKKFRGT